ncbi:unnamed protein product [Orchesella dallaii]|uniref:Major facilitator superfamily (MFS) profile domain-containing protein n=1 Tax=Orchesella dallaii TaxID=48710 RepID=A0ABP1RF18_9HEXA
METLQHNLERLGDFGRYQKFQHGLHLLCWLTGGIHFMSFLFVFPSLEHRCFVNGIDDNEYLINNNSLEAATEGLLDNYIPVNDSSCSMYANGSESSVIIPCENGYIYSSEYFQSSRVTNWDMVCEREWMRAFIQSMFMFGTVLGALITGLLADKYGRKPVTCVSGVAQLVFGFISVYIPSFLGLSLCMFLYGAFGVAGAMVPTVSLTMEIVGASRRQLCGILFASAFSLGSILVCIWAWFLPQSATQLQLIFALHSVLLLGHFWIMDESICWLWTVGQKSKALELVQKAARWNGTRNDEIELLPLKSLDENDPMVYWEKGNDPIMMRKQRSYGLFDIFRYPEIRRRSLTMFYICFGGGSMYNGLIYNSVNLFENPYLVFIINFLAEIPGNILVIWLAPKFGNKKMLIYTFLSSGLLSIVLAFSTVDIVNIILSFVVKILTTMAINTVTTFAAELFPTVVRNTALGFCMMSSRLGITWIQKIILVGKSFVPTLNIFFGVFGLSASLLVCLLIPETMNRPMPQTIGEVEVHGKQRKESYIRFLLCCHY